MTSVANARHLCICGGHTRNKCLHTRCTQSRPHKRRYKYITRPIAVINALTTSSTLPWRASSARRNCENDLAVVARGPPAARARSEINIFIFAAGAPAVFLKITGLEMVIWLWPPPHEDRRSEALRKIKYRLYVTSCVYAITFSYFFSFFFFFFLSHSTNEWRKYGTRDTDVRNFLRTPRRNLEQSDFFRSLDYETQMLN